MVHQVTSTAEFKEAISKPQLVRGRTDNHLVV